MKYATVESVRYGWPLIDNTPTSSNERAMDTLLHSVLEGDANISAHLFSDSGPKPLRRLALQRFEEEQRIEWQHLALFPKLSDENEYVFVAPNRALSRACGLRGATGRLSFPICALMDPMDMADPFGDAIAGLLQMLRCDLLLVSSEMARGALLEVWSCAADMLRGARGLSGTPWVERIPTGVDTEEFKPRDRSFCRDALTLPHDCVLFLCIPEAVRGWRLDMELIFSVVKELPADYPPMELVVVASDKAHKEQIEVLARLVGVQGACRIVVDLASSAIPLLFGAVDAFIALDSFLQADSQALILQAKASRLPTVASAWGANRELIDDGATGLLIPAYWNPIAGAMMPWLEAGDGADQFLADRTVFDGRAMREALEVLLVQPELRARLGECARRDVERQHALKRVGTLLLDLWCTQYQTLRALPETINAPFIDYTKLFSNFATGQLSEDLPISMGTRGRLMLGNDLRAADRSMVPSLLRADVGKLLERIKNGPTRLGDHLDVGSQFSFEAIVWLLRRGYLFAGDGHTARTAATLANVQSSPK